MMMIYGRIGMWGAGNACCVLRVACTVIEELGEKPVTNDRSRNTQHGLDWRQSWKNA